MRIFSLALKYVVRNKSLILSLIITFLLLMLSLQYMLVLSTPENNVFIDNYIKDYRPHFLFVLTGIYKDVNYSDPVKSYEDFSSIVFKSIPIEGDDVLSKNITTALSFLELSSEDGSYLTVVISRYSPTSFGFQPISESQSQILIVKNSLLSKNLSTYLEEKLGYGSVVGLMQTSIDDPIRLNVKYDYDYLWIVSGNSSEVNFYISLIKDFVEESPGVSMFNSSAIYIAVNYVELPFDIRALQGFFDRVYSDIVEFYSSFSLSIDATPSNGSIVKIFMEEPDETPFTRRPKYHLSITHEGILRNIEFLSRSGGEVLFYLSYIFIPILFPILALLLGIIYRLRSDLNLIDKVVLFRGLRGNVVIPITGSLFIISYIASSILYISLSILYGALVFSWSTLLVISGVLLITALFVVKGRVENLRISRRLFLASLIIFLVVTISGVTRVSFMEILLKYPFLIPIYLFSIPFFPITLLIIYLYIFSYGHLIIKLVCSDYFNSYPVRLWKSNIYLNYMKVGVFSFVLAFSLLGDSVLKVYLDIIGNSGMVYKLGFPRVLSLYTINQLILFSRDIVLLLLPLLYLLYLFSIYRVLRYDEIKMKFRGIHKNVIKKFKFKVFMSHIISDFLVSGLGALLFYIFLEGYIGLYYGYYSPLEDIVYDPPRLLEVFLWRIL